MTITIDTWPNIHPDGCEIRGGECGADVSYPPPHLHSHPFCSQHPRIVCRPVKSVMIAILALPTELWLIIFELVIQEGIVRVDDCDNTKFPYIQSILSTTRLRYHFHGSYYRLRLVCRNFKAILGDPPSQILLPSSTFPLSTTIRAAILDLNAWPRANFQLLTTAMSSCGRLLYLDVTCQLISGSVRPNLSDFLRASAGRAFPNVQRLTLRIVMNIYTHDEKGFWDRLQDAFPLLVTLGITREGNNGGYIVLNAASSIISLDYLEILYLSREIAYDRCRFPRLRHASIWNNSQDRPEILADSSHLESLLIHSFYNNTMHLMARSQVKLLGIHASVCHYLNSMGSDYPLEHLWIFPENHPGTYQSIPASLMRLPRVLRITVELSSSMSEQGRSWITQEFQETDFASIGMNMRQYVEGDGVLVIERSPASVDG